MSLPVCILITPILEFRLASILITRFMLDLAEHDIGPGVMGDPGFSFDSLVIPDMIHLGLRAQELYRPSTRLTVTDLEVDESTSVGTQRVATNTTAPLGRQQRYSNVTRQTSATTDPYQHVQ